MRLYISLGSSNPRRVTIYLVEKGLELETVIVDTRKGEQKASDFLAKNPIGKVPVLETDDGIFLPESSAIVEYIEEKHPSPPMFGDTPEARARTRAAERKVAELFTLMSAVLMNSHPVFLVRRPGATQYPDVAVALQPMVDALLDALEIEMGDDPFLAGKGVTVADCSFFALTSSLNQTFDYELPERCPRLRKWFVAFKARPSANAA